MHFGIPKCYLEMQVGLRTHGLGKTGAVLHVGKKLLHGARLPFSGPRSNNLRLHLSEVHFHVGICPPHSFQTRGSLPAVDLLNGLLQSRQEPKEAGWRHLHWPQIDAEILERRPHHPEKFR